MPVAYNQIDEILDVVAEFTHPKNRMGLLVRLKQTNAYKQNKSYAATIDRLINRWNETEAINATATTPFRRI